MLLHPNCCRAGATFDPLGGTTTCSTALSIQEFLEDDPMPLHQAIGHFLQALFTRMS